MDGRDLVVGAEDAAHHPCGVAADDCEGWYILLVCQYAVDFSM